MNWQKYFWEQAQKKIEREPEEYRTQFCDYGYYNNGCGWASCGGEWEYDEDRAYDDAVEEMIDFVNNGEWIQIDDFFYMPEVEEDLKKIPNYDEGFDFLYTDSGKEAAINLIKGYAYGDNANA